MNLALTAAGASVRAAAALSPRWAAAVAMPLFGYVAKPRPVHADDEPTMLRARPRTVRVPGVDRRGVDVDTYEWGDGPRTVVLSHGWNGRASQFSMLVRELVAEGYRVVSFDAPAHGASGGRRTYLVDWLGVFAALQERHGAFEAMVGHSFGGLATLVGVAGGVDAARVVTIAAPADADLLLSQFQGMLGYPDAVATSMQELFARRYFPGEADPFAWLSSVRRPLPAGVPLLVAHDHGDRVVPFGEAGRIIAANHGSRLLATQGLGHNRILTDDAVLDAVLGHVRSPLDVAAPAEVEELGEAPVAA
ncbi:alpha/beta hydrolase [Microbacterium trichothecenolyticum]|uniref:alpha/beta hydrolase family protein n=1 Tax=Microbacterium trichothecenolyticum TaxID=69370 RepID=UPI001C6E1BAA|nr:alpha/beta hydrolase [Microbacterium trichothecenolyticum]MBW9121194.1 alpha/beta hydrolase [Microbacterium trichothecenolyticum]